MRIFGIFIFECRLRASNSLFSADETTQTIDGSIRSEVEGIPGWSALPCGQLVAMESVALELSKQVALFLREHASTLPLREEVLQQHSAFEVLIRLRFWMHSGDFLRRDRLPDFSEGPADQSLVEVSGKCNGQITILVSHGRRAKPEWLFAHCTCQRLPQATDPLGLRRNPAVGPFGGSLRCASRT